MRMTRIAICGSVQARNFTEVLKKYAPSDFYVEYFGVIEPFIAGYDVIIDFGLHPRNILYSRLCDGVIINRVQGSDVYKPTIGIYALRVLAKKFCTNIIYASDGLKKRLRLPGKVLVNPVNSDLFYPRNVHRDKDVCYYIRPEKEKLYCKDMVPQGSTLLDGSIPYEEMPFVFSSHKRYVRYTESDANPKMPYEALLCGCKVEYNGVYITKVPDFMTINYQIPKWIQYIRNVFYLFGDKY